MAPQSSVPSTLPPSVEEAYRRKCVQLKNRTTEVEEANDAARLRLSRIKRQVEKLRVERAFLLEQLAKRTSTNVEDSDGSPSPPPTEQPPANRNTTSFLSEPDANLAKPKEKPLRIKRGHRKVSAVADDNEPKASDASVSFANPAQSPSPGASEHPRSADDTTAAELDSDKVEKDAFELFCKDQRPVEKEKQSSEDKDINMDEVLERSWKDAEPSVKDKFYAEVRASKPQQEEIVAGGAAPSKNKESAERDEEDPVPKDEDVEMRDNDNAGQDPPAEKEGGG